MNYAGTIEQWKEIKIEDKNETLLFQEIHCSDGSFTPLTAITGTCGEDENVTYSLTKDGVLTVSGAGAWEYYAFEDNTKITKAILEEGVTEIGWGGFFWCTKMKELIIPDTVTILKSYSIYCANKLPSLRIPVSVTTIEAEAISGCDELRDIYYDGTEEQWARIDIGEENFSLENATIHFAGGGTAIPNDVNGDGVVDTKDVQAILHIVVGGWKPGPVVEARANIDHDGGVTTKDAIRLFLIVLRGE